MSKMLHPKKNSHSVRPMVFGVDSDLRKDLERYNPTLKNVLKVEGLFERHIEFDSKSQLLRRLDCSMKAPVLNVILRYLKGIGKVLENEDGSWTWIYGAGNKKLLASYERAIKL